MNGSPRKNAVELGDWPPITLPEVIGVLKELIKEIGIYTIPMTNQARNTSKRERWVTIENTKKKKKVKKITAKSSIIYREKQSMIEQGTTGKSIPKKVTRVTPPDPHNAHLLRLMIIIKG